MYTKVTNVDATKLHQIIKYLALYRMYMDEIIQKTNN